MSDVDVNARALIEATKVMGAWAYPEVRRISELMELVYLEQDITIEIANFGTVAFQPHALHLASNGLSVTLRFEEDDRRYMLMLDCMNLDFGNDLLGNNIRVTFRHEYDPSTEEYAVQDLIRTKLAAAV